MSQWTKLMRQYDQVALEECRKAILVSDQFVTMATSGSNHEHRVFHMARLRGGPRCGLLLDKLQIALILINLLFIVVFVIAGMSYLG